MADTKLNPCICDVNLKPNTQVYEFDDYSLVLLRWTNSLLCLDPDKQKKK